MDLYGAVVTDEPTNQMCDKAALLKFLKNSKGSYGRCRVQRQGYRYWSIQKEDQKEAIKVLKTRHGSALPSAGQLHYNILFSVSIIIIKLQLGFLQQTASILPPRIIL